jgi:hypothetical protein
VKNAAIFPQNNFKAIATPATPPKRTWRIILPVPASRYAKHGVAKINTKKFEIKKAHFFIAFLLLLDSTYPLVEK